MSWQISLPVCGHQALFDQGRSGSSLGHGSAVVRHIMRACVAGNGTMLNGHVECVACRYSLEHARAKARRFRHTPGQKILIELLIRYMHRTRTETNRHTFTIGQRGRRRHSRRQPSRARRVAGVGHHVACVASGTRYGAGGARERLGAVARVHRGVRVGQSRALGKGCARE